MTRRRANRYPADDRRGGARREDRAAQDLAARVARSAGLLAPSQPAMAPPADGRLTTPTDATRNLDAFRTSR
jgi:hypothetical protein